MNVQIRLMYRLRMKYFREFWSCIDLGIIGCSWAGVGMYVWKYRESTHIGDLFAQTNGYVYLSLQVAIYVQDTLTYLLGFCCFFGTIKFLRLCRFDQRLSLFSETIRLARNDLFSFAWMYSLVFVAFLMLFYLLFVSAIPSCGNLLNTAQMLFEMTLLKFDAGELTAAASFLGPFCFCLFIFLMVFVCMSMFVTIINDNFRLARNNLHEVHRKKDTQIWSFIFGTFLSWIGSSSAVDVL